MPEAYEEIIPDEILREGNSLGCYYAGNEECTGVVESFIKRALRKGSKVFTVLDGYEPPIVRQSSFQGEADLPVSGVVRIAQNDIPAEKDAFIEYLNKEMDKTLGSTWKGIWICLDVCSLPGRFLSQGFVSFMEELLSLNRSGSCSILFLYDTRKLAPDVMIESLSIHPRVIIEGKLINNTYFVPARPKDGKEFLHTMVNECLNGLVRGERFRQEIKDLEDKHLFLFEKRIKKSEEKYRTILESIEEGYYEVDLNGKFIFSNNSLCRILGCPSDELLGMNYSSFVDEKTALEIHQTFNTVFATGKDLESTEWEFYRKSDGVKISIEISISRIMSKEGKCKGFGGIVRDVSHRVQAEKALILSEERYRNIFNNVSDFLYYHDLQGSFDFEEVNERVKRAWGYYPGSKRFMNLKDVMPERHRKYFDSYLKRIRGKETDEGLLTVVFREDGQEHVLEYRNSLVYKNGVAVGIQGSARDVTDRISAERELKKSEEKYRTILENIEEGYYETDLKGTFTFCNGSLCRILGCTSDELIGIGYSSFVDENTAKKIFSTFHKVYKTGKDVDTAEWEFARKSDGRKINIEVSVSGIMSNNVQCSGFRGIIRDVTNRVQSEKALVESEQRYRLLAENVSDIIWRADLDFNFTYVSPSVKQIAGATAEDTLKLNVRHVMNEEMFRKVQDDFQQILDNISKGESYPDTVRRYEFEHGRADGSTFWADTIASVQFDRDGKPVGVVGVTRDISERIKAEEEIKKNEIKYRSILEGIEEGYYEIDLSGRFTFFNDSECRILGFSREELAGMNYRKYMDEENARKVFQIYNRVYETGIPERGVGWEFIRKDGVTIQVESSIQLIRESNGNPIGFRGVLRDITDRIQTEEFKAAKLKAESENRAKSEFLANMSHEIRTPLNGIIGMTELAMDTSLDENQKDIVHVINRESEILLNLINDILDFSKIEADRYEIEEIPFDLRVLIEDLAHSFAMRSEKKRLEFVSFLSPDVPVRLMGDPGRLRQVIANLAGNALKFTEKGEIFIKVETDEDMDERVRLKFSVRDTGIGIAADKQGKIFDSFTQADGSTTRKYGGTGLGLAISKKIVEMMGGSIGVDSVEGEGSTFYFTASFVKQKEKKLYPMLEEGDIKGMRVLIVDDNETNRFILLEYLKTWGCLPVDFPGGMETINILRAAVAVNEPFDLILMDFNMPEMDGFELARKIREVESLKRVPIIILTSLGDLGDGKSCRNIGIQGYLPKPTRRDDLKKAILSVMGISKADETEEISKLITRHTVVEDYRKDIQILLAEDYPTNQQVAMRHLYKVGYQVEVAENGQQAVSAFKRKRYDLILMDIQMPIMDGYEATKQIREWENKLLEKFPSGATGHRKKIPIIAMTAHAITGYRDKCIDAGMDDYIAKPLRREELIRMVDKWIEKKELMEDGPTDTIAQMKTKGDTSMEKAQRPIDLEKVMSEFDADRDFLKEILGGFLQNVRKQIEIIRSAIQQRNAETVRKEAHSIKGGAANICADDLSRAALALENLGKSGNVDTGEELLKHLEEEFIRLDEFDKTEL